MNIEQLKSTWRQRTGKHTDNLESENRRMAKQLATGKAVAAQHRLAKTALRKFRIGLLLPVFAPLLYYYLGFQLWIAVLYAIFGIIMAIANLLFYNSIIKNDYMSLPLVEAMMEAVKIRTNLRYNRILGVSLGFAMVFSLIFYALNREIAILIGMIVGFIVGLFIGLRKWCEQTALSKAIIRELKVAIHETECDFDIPLDSDFK